MQEKDITKGNSKKLTDKEIELTFESLWDQKKHERKVIVHRYCPNKGWVDGFEFCDDPECPSCGFILKIMDEAIKEELSKYEESTNNGD